MATLKSIDMYPYSGWMDRPWGLGADGSTPSQWTADDLDLDAAARSSRRVAEALSMHLRAAAISSRRSSYRTMLLEGRGVDAVTVSRLPVRHGPGPTLITSGFRNLLPDQRADVLLSALHRNLAPLAADEGWTAELDACVARIREDGYACKWTSAWKRTRDRTLLVRIVARIEDDGYGRWIAEIADSETNVLRRTRELIGWTWVSNFEVMAKEMRFAAPHVLTVGRGSGFLHTESVIDLDTGSVAESEDGPVQILNYPGDPGLTAPDVVVGELPL